MKIVFFSNFLNHHQVLLCDELYEATNKSFVFISLYEMPVSFKKSGYPDYSDRPYMLKAYDSEENMRKAHAYALSADVALFGEPQALPFEVERAKAGMLSFEVGERWLKRGWINVFSPRLIKNQWYYHTLFYRKPVYRLCSSAYAAVDVRRLHSFKGRCYKWGYFTKVDESFDPDAPISDASASESTHLMWCARFLKWKHPELPVQLAYRLKKKGYNFLIDMFGSGEEYENTKGLMKALDVEQCVKLRGNLPNDEMLKEMRKHSIFLFTSDQNEGWGAVLNEAMSNGCAVVASHAIGAAPFLIKDGTNGYVFESENIEQLYEKVVFLMEHPSERKRVAKEAYYTMKNIWSPRNAAHNFLKLIESLEKGEDAAIEEGPCSKA
ncbi:MAG: glycosyltransferase [Bacteroidales bacterium]|nr:glycosyltransferase [Bacteroidales bacterium]